MAYMWNRLTNYYFVTADSVIVFKIRLD